MPHIYLDDQGMRIVWTYLEDLWTTESLDGRTLSPPRRLELPVSTGWKEGGGPCFKDEQGRYVMQFGSDRSSDHEWATYLCWSRDFVNWSAPARVGQRISYLVQEEGRYLGVAFDRTSDDEAQPAAMTSRDLLQWERLGKTTGWRMNCSERSILRREDGTYEMYSVFRTKPFPARYGRPYTISLVATFRQTSPDALAWSEPVELDRGLGWGRDSSSGLGSCRLFSIRANGRTVLMQIRQHELPIQISIKFLRETADGSWQVSPWIDSLLPMNRPPVMADIAYHPQWGYVLAWCGDGSEDAVDLHVMRTGSLDSIFNSPPSPASQDWQAREWSAQALQLQIDGQKEAAQAAWQRVAREFPQTTWAKEAEKQLATPK